MTHLFGKSLYLPITRHPTKAEMELSAPLGFQPEKPTWFTIPFHQLLSQRQKGSRNFPSLTLKKGARPGIKPHVPGLQQPPTTLAPLEEAPSILRQLLLAEALAQKPKGAMETSLRTTAGQGKTRDLISLPLRKHWCFSYAKKPCRFQRTSPLRRGQHHINASPCLSTR